MATLKQNLSVNGQGVSNNDPDMVIKLDDHSVVQIDSIQDNSITYKFLTDVTEEVIYTLNLTFTYKGTHQLIVPLTFTHDIIQPKVEINLDPKEISGILGELKMINPNIKLDNVPVTPDNPGVTYELNPTGIIDINRVTSEGIEVIFKGNPEEETTENVTITTHIGTSSTQEDLVVITRAPKLVVASVLDPNTVSGYLKTSF